MSAVSPAPQRAHDAIRGFAYFLRSNSPYKAAVAFYVVISEQWDYRKPQRFPGIIFSAGNNVKLTDDKHCKPGLLGAAEVILYAQKICASA
jgi:hypothetical protein